MIGLSPLLFFFAIVPACGGRALSDPSASTSGGATPPESSSGTGASGSGSGSTSSGGASECKDGETRSWCVWPQGCLDSPYEKCVHGHWYCPPPPSECCGGPMPTCPCGSPQCQYGSSPHWACYGSCPDAGTSFACGDSNSCLAAEVCTVTAPGIPDGGSLGYACLPIPAPCSTGATCECITAALKAQGPCIVASCSVDASGNVTVECVAL